MRRRTLLATLLGGTTATTGCSGLTGPAARRETERLTPAPVGSATRRRGGTATPESCPELPTNAEVYVCSGAKDEGLRFRPATPPDAGAAALELRNGTTLPFNTGPDWWTLARRLPATGDWTIVDQGAGAGRLQLGPGESFEWVVRRADAGGGATTSGSGAARRATDGTTRTADSRSARLVAPISPGRYALSVVGYFGGGELTAVIDRFVIGPVE